MKFKVNDKVYDSIMEQYGIITSINFSPSDSYPITVKFRDNTIQYYTSEGKFIDGPEFSIRLEFVSSKLRIQQLMKQMGYEIE